MKLWITKYALSAGIEEVDAEPEGDEKSMLCIREKGYTRFFHGDGKDWHRTRESAAKKAEEMRVAKINSLQKQIEKLKKVSLNGIRSSYHQSANHPLRASENERPDGVCSAASHDAGQDGPNCVDTTPYESKVDELHTRVILCITDGGVATWVGAGSERTVLFDPIQDDLHADSRLAWVHGFGKPHRTGDGEHGSGLRR